VSERWQTQGKLILTEWALYSYSRSRQIDKHTVQHGKHDVRSLTLLGSLQEVFVQKHIISNKHSKQEY